MKIEMKLPDKKYCLSKVDGLPLYPCCDTHAFYNKIVDEFKQSAQVEVGLDMDNLAILIQRNVSKKDVLPKNSVDVLSLDTCLRIATALISNEARIIKVRK